MTSNFVQDKRRALLKAAATAPLLPLAGSAVGATLLSACGSSGKGKATVPASAAYRATTFTNMAAPTLNNAQQMAATHTASQMLLHYADGKQAAFDLGYETFFMTGDWVPDGKGGKVLAGGYFDIHNRPIIDRSVPARTRQFFSDCPDGSSLLTLPNANVAGVKGKPVFAVVQFEYLTRNLAGDEAKTREQVRQTDMYGKLPSPIAVLTLDQNPANGKLSLVKYHNVDTSAVNGLWITCGASLSPWNTHLSSEEYEPDAVFGDANLKPFSRHLYGDENRANPYHYGHMPEVTVHPDGSGTVEKHYCLGRISHELIQVMPDERTALMGDDATNGGLFLFVADRARDLSSGTLYVAKWHQRSGVGAGAADLSWIHLGHASSSEIRALVDGGIRHHDIMAVHKEAPQETGFQKIPFSGGFNWVKLKPGMAKAAAFLETHRYAALRGGSMGFTKMEGTTVNAADKIAYSAMSYIQSSMLNGSGDIKVQGPKAGAVYALDLRGSQKDDRGTPIDSAWVPVNMAAPAALVGEDLAVPDALGNTAHADKIANPDNIKFDEKLRTLFIGEDSGMHVNNFVWAWNVDSKQLSRILSMPAGAEATGLHAVGNINGWTYIMSNFQHAGDWKKSLHGKIRSDVEPLIRARYRDRYGAAVGYLTGARVV